MYMQDEYHALSYKTMALWRLAEDNFDIDYLIKVDDDNFVRLDRLAIATHQWDEENAGVQPQSALSKYPRQGKSSNTQGAVSVSTSKC